MLNWFRNRKVGTKLFAGFMLCSGLTLIVAAEGVIVINQLDEGKEKMFKEVVIPLEELAEVSQHFERQQVALRDLMIASSPEDSAEILQRVKELEEKVRDDVKRFSHSASDGEMKTTLTTFTAKFDEYIDTEKQILSFLAQESVEGKESALQLMRGPAAKSAHDAEIAVDKMLSVMRAQAEKLHELSKQETAEALNKVYFFAGLALLLALAAGYWIRSIIVAPLKDLVSLATAVESGNLTVTVKTWYQDEVGDVSKAFRGMVEGLRSMVGNITEISTQVAAASEELLATSSQISANAQETSKQCGVVAAAAEEISRNLQTVSAASEEMSSSIGEISNNTSSAAEETSRASSEADQASTTIKQLGESVARIGDVSKIISSIADQTNLLALNATIEAARAGEAGKGFAVVANEVKELAQETQKATGSIGECIERVRGDSNAVLEAIERIVSVIQKTKEITSTIAAAVEEQSATTQETVRNIAECAVGGREITSNMSAVAKASDETTVGVTQSLAAAQELSRMAQQLKSTISRFRVDSRSGTPRAPVITLTQPARENGNHQSESYESHPVM